MHEGGKKAVIAALLANAGIAIAKLIGFLITGAASMMAESIHSLADTGNQGLLLLGSNRSNREADEQHPFGYGAERYFWAFIVAIVLFTLGSMFALFEGIEKLLHPHELESPFVAVGILLFAVIAEGFSFRTAYHEASKVRGDQSWWKFIRRTKNPELSVVLLEDTGALLGLLFALFGVGFAELTGNPRFDAIGSVAIGLLLGTIAIILASEQKSLLIGEAADKTVVERIRTAITQAEFVRHLIHLRTLQLGPEELLVAAKVEFAPELEQTEVNKAIDGVEVQIRAAVPDANLIFIEPDVLRVT